jgi:hypothetical protein
MLWALLAAPAPAESPRGRQTTIRRAMGRIACVAVLMVPLRWGYETYQTLAYQNTWVAPSFAPAQTREIFSDNLENLRYRGILRLDSALEVALDPSEPKLPRLDPKGSQRQVIRARLEEFGAITTRDETTGKITIQLPETITEEQRRLLFFEALVQIWMQRIQTDINNGWTQLPRTLPELTSETAMSAGFYVETRHRKIQVLPREAR